MDQEWTRGTGKTMVLGGGPVAFRTTVTHRAPERMRESSYPTLAHEPPEKSDATRPSSPDVGTKGHQQSPG